MNIKMPTLKDTVNNTTVSEEVEMDEYTAEQAAARVRLRNRIDEVSEKIERMAYKMALKRRPAGAPGEVDEEADGVIYDKAAGKVSKGA
jgi:hypothetical protein